MSTTAADYMAETLVRAGVKRVYGVVGDSLNGFTDALRRLKSVEWVHMLPWNMVVLHLWTWSVRNRS
jgi:pyruvate dehydrogenase (quinone)